MQSLWSISWWIVSLCIAAVFMKAASPSVVGVTAAAAVVADVVVVVVIAAAAAAVIDVMLTGTSKKCYFEIFLM